jgi:hypothetical protein
MKDYLTLAIETLHDSNYKEEHKAEILLWRSVVIQALEDLNLSTYAKKNKRWHNQAIQWFVDKDENFYTICECAELCPEKVLNIASNIIANMNL